ncbi:MAG: hypothetical protein RIK87_14235 [Fuerstiella sp.]
MKHSQVILFATDLMLGSTVGGHAASHGLACHTTADISGLKAVVSAATNFLLLVDLGTPGLDIRQLADAVPAATLQTAIAYGPHVHREKLEAARQCGFGQVMSRGQFNAQVGQLIASAAAADDGT